MAIPAGLGRATGAGWKALSWCGQHIFSLAKAPCPNTQSLPRLLLKGMKARDTGIGPLARTSWLLEPDLATAASRIHPSPVTWAHVRKQAQRGRVCACVASFSSSWLNLVTSQPSKKLLSYLWGYPGSIVCTVYPSLCSCPHCTP